MVHTWENRRLLYVKSKNINVYYDAIHAIKDVSFKVNEGEIVTLIGANGAGKTTILHTVSGLMKAKSGEISFQKQKIDHLEAHKLYNWVLPMFLKEEEFLPK